MALLQRSFSDIITFTRASGGGRFNANGQYEWFPANTPRIDYDPVTGECRGLLIEEQRTNLLTYSSDFANAAWVKAACSISSNAATSPEGFEAGDKLVESETNAQHYVNTVANTSFVSGTAYTYSIFAKAGERGFLLMSFNSTTFPNYGRRAFFNLNSGEVSYDEPGVTARITGVGAGWYRCSITVVATSTAVAITGYVGVLQNGGSQSDLSYMGDGTSGIYIWGAQLEAGSFPTSYIPTTTAQVTRAADVASVNELSPWYNASEGTLFVEFAQFGAGEGIGRVISLNDGTTGNLIDIGRSTNGVQSVVNSGALLQSNLIEQDPKAPIRSKIRASAAYRHDNFALSVNGKPALVDITGVVPSVTALRIGARLPTTFMLNGYIRSIRYYPKRLSNTELQALTA